MNEVLKNLGLGLAGKLIAIGVLAPWPDDRPIPPTNVVPSTRRIYRLSALGRRPEMDMLWEDPLARGPLRELLAGAIPF